MPTLTPVQDLPPRTHPRAFAPKWGENLPPVLRAHPGAWFEVSEDEAFTRRRVANLAQKIRGRSGAFKAGSGRYEAATRTIDGQIRLYVRWVPDAPEDASPVFSAA
ncbi:MAG TPA: hypothetical protein VKZ58_00175 [Longimicrobiales bacterium]|nr:hypothetical protein [Longimicrobiales bacterium]